MHLIRYVATLAVTPTVLLAACTNTPVVSPTGVSSLGAAVLPSSVAQTATIIPSPADPVAASGSCSGNVEKDTPIKTRDNYNFSIHLSLALAPSTDTANRPSFTSGDCVVTPQITIINLDSYNDPSPDLTLAFYQPAAWTKESVSYDSSQPPCFGGTPTPPDRCIFNPPNQGYSTGLSNPLAVDAHEGSYNPPLIPAGGFTPYYLAPFSIPMDSTLANFDIFSAPPYVTTVNLLH